MSISLIFLSKQFSSSKLFSFNRRFLVSVDQSINMHLWIIYPYKFTYKKR